MNSKDNGHFVPGMRGIGARSGWVLILIMMLSLLLGHSPILGQELVIWSQPENLSRTATASAHPAILADDYGNVHVFWSEAVGGEPVGNNRPTEVGNAIMYRRWNGNRWSVPIDVLTSPDEDRAEFVAVDMDSSGILYAVWGGQDRFYFSSAVATEANSAQAWTTPGVIASGSARSLREVDIAVDNEDRLHVIYAARTPSHSVYHISSDDGGVNWTLDEQISAALQSPEQGYANLRIVSDPKGRLHATWQAFQQDGYGQSVYYARSVDGGQSWSEPEQFRFREEGDTFVEWPYLTVRGEDELHLNYVNGTTNGRAYRYSLDAGENWSAPQQILEELEGINGYVIPLVDGNDRLHWIANMRTAAGQKVGIYHSFELVQGGWSPVEAVDDFSPAAPSAHYTAAAVHLGSEIHVVYNQIENGEIWYVRGDVQDVERQATVALPDSEGAVSEAVEGQSAPAEGTPAETRPVEIDTLPPENDDPPFVPIIAGIGAALVIVIALVVIIRNRR